MNIVRLVIIVILFLIYIEKNLVNYVKKFEEINIDMEYFYKKVL